MVKWRGTWARILYLAITLMALALVAGAGFQWD